jgi:hypothetical protein
MMNREKLAAVFLAAAMVLGLAASAGAVDGTIEINQAKVLAAGGFPYTISNTGGYRLTGNLMVPASTNGINVTAPNVTIDLNGFSITGPGSTGATPIGINAGLNDVTVKNGTVTGFGNGVFLGDSAIVNAVEANSNSAEGIQVGNSSLVQGCTASSNNDGITGVGNGILISGNAANSNVRYGIETNGHGIVVSGNAEFGNAIGINYLKDGGLISGNTVYSNGIGHNGIVTVGGTTAYGGNVLTNTFNVSGGTSLGNNLCSGVVC